MALIRKPGIVLRLRAPVLAAVYLRQLYFTGVQAAALAALAGAMMAWVFFNILHGRFHNDSDLTLRILSTIGLQELAPVTVTLLLVARSVSAVVTELASMRVSGEIRTLLRHGIDPIEYLVAPRAVGFILGSALLFVYFAAGALLAGGFLAVPGHPLAELYRLAQNVPAQPLKHGILRCMTFSASVAVAACALGINVRERSTAVPRTAARAVILSLVVLFVFDGIATYLNE
jgi:phospholipid/cholesterol/gamma-HCH transport system permease protein